MTQKRKEANDLRANPGQEKKGNQEMGEKEKEPKEKETKEVELKPITLEEIDVRVVGSSPLICHRLSEAAIERMRDKQTGKASKGKPPRVPEQEFRDSLYVLPDGGYGFPVQAFYRALVAACRYIDMTMVFAKGAFSVLSPEGGSLVRIEGSEPRMREDLVKIGRGTKTLRYRGQFDEWATTVRVRYNPDAISAEQIVNLFHIAGFSQGVGEWRPGAPKGGIHGQFTVATEA